MLKLIKNNVVAQAFLISSVFHVALFCVIVSVSEICKKYFYHESRESIIEIEFTK